ncbi:hypothetical protein IW152_002416 [Coemansia sp. BCRC 34962]|nr:hypothetical protein IW152_002416 [Coemansia sp. BCRC 34962]
MTALADINVEELHTLKRKQLQSLCKKHGVKANGKSEEIIERLIERIKKGGTDNASNDSGTDSDSDDDNDGQRYDSATDEVKPSTLPEGGNQTTTPGKLFKVVPLLNTKPVEMDAPESMTVIEQAQFASQVEKFTAELEARAAAIAAQMGNGEVEKYNPAYGLIVKTPQNKNATKTISFDKAHEKLFNSSDSIANHWSAKKVVTTPSNKRANDGVPESNKRPRVEVLFESPAVQPQSAGAKRKSTRTKSMTVKAQRTAAPGASLDGSKTVAAERRVKPTGNAAALSSTKLFDTLPATLESKAVEVDFAPLIDAASSTKIESKSTSTIGSPRMSRSDKKADTVSLMSPTKSASKTKAATTPARTPAKAAATPAKTPAKAAATPAKTPARITATPAKTAAAPKEDSAAPLAALPATPAVAAKVCVAKPATPITVPSIENPLPEMKVDSVAPAKSSAQKKSAVPVTKTSQIPMARKIAKPRSVALLAASATAPKKAALQSKIRAPKKPEVAKPPPKQAVAKPSPAPISATKAPATTKLPSAQPVGFRNVESKLKSYINAKPSPPKVKAIKPSRPDMKSSAKPNTATEKPIKPAAAPAASVATKDSVGKDMPNYMKPTRTKEVRSKQVTAKVLSKPGPGMPVKTSDGKARFNPYNRPTKPVAVKPSAAK